jgi:hypothetical protein
MSRVWPTKPPRYPIWYFPSNELIQAYYYAEAGPFKELKERNRETFNGVLQTIKDYREMCDRFQGAHEFTPNCIFEMQYLLREFELDVSDMLLVNEPLFG